jgi:hypothetical protein
MSYQSIKNSLKPCPACGHNEVYLAGFWFGSLPPFGVMCLRVKCIHRGPLRITRKKAADAWNKLKTRCP